VSWERVVVLLVCVLAAVAATGCGRALTSGEIAYAEAIFGGEIDYEQVSVSQSQLPDWGDARAMAIKNSLLFRRGNYFEDFTAVATTPDGPFISDRALLAHELMHVWQWQNRKETGFSLARAIAEHLEYGDDVYKYGYPFENGDYLDYRYEQQGKIVEDWAMWRLFWSEEKDEAYLELLRSRLPVPRPDEIGR